MRRTLRFAAPALLLLLTGAVEPGEAPRAQSPVKEQAASFYPQDANGPAVLDAALAKAKAQGKKAVIVFGADWCHDSRDLAKVLTSDGFKARFGTRYAVTFIDVGVPQTGRGRNLDLVRRFGFKDLKSTPALFVISPKGKRINSKKDAVSWRNASSRREVAILDWFESLK